MILPRDIALTVAAIATGACGSTRDEVDLAEVRQELGKAAEAVAGEAAEQGHGAQRAIEAKLAELEKRLEEARRAVHAARDAKARAARKLAELELEGRQLRQRLEKARRSGARAWTEIEQAIDRALVEMETTLGASEE